jgi:hypothetical protein
VRLEVKQHNKRLQTSSLPTNGTYLCALWTRWYDAEHRSAMGVIDPSSSAGW